MAFYELQKVARAFKSIQESSIPRAPNKISSLDRSLPDSRNTMNNLLQQPLKLNLEIVTYNVKCLGDWHAEL